MPEPDFDQIARGVPIMSCEACAAGMRRVADGVHYDDTKGGSTWGVCRTVVAELKIAEHLRQVWNARGAADVDVLQGIYGVQGATVADVTRALQRRDR